MSFIGNIFILDDVLKSKFCNDLKYPNVTVEQDICYDKSNEKLCRADIFYDKNKNSSAKYPVMLKIHGGGWIVGDKKYRRGYSLQLADEGLFVVNINYGLAPEYQFPYPIQNCFAALQWIKDNAKIYNLDLNNLFVAGDSAGGHMTAVVCAALTNPIYRKKLNCPDVGLIPQGALLYCGLYDFNDFKMKLPLADVMLKGYTGIKPKELKTYKYNDYLNPTKYITGDFPKSLVVSGIKDIMTWKNHEHIMEQMDNVGVKYISFRAKNFFNSFHCFHLKIWMGAAKKCLKISRKFVTEIVKENRKNKPVEELKIAE